MSRASLACAAMGVLFANGVAAATGLALDPDLSAMIGSRAVVHASCATAEGRAALLLFVDARKHALLLLREFDRQVAAIAWTEFEFSAGGRPQMLETSAGLALENELAGYRDFLLRQPLAFSTGTAWLSNPPVIACPTPAQQ